MRGDHGLRQRPRREGYVLLAVSLGLIVLSLFALSAMEVGQGESQLRAANAAASNARYAAQAGIAKAQWQLDQNDVCNAYQGVVDTEVGEFSVSAMVSPASGSPVVIRSRAENAAGVAVEMTRDGVPVSRASETVVIAPGEAGEDTRIRGDDTDKNDGGSKDLIVGIALPRISLMKFDLLEVPLGARVLDARLELHYESVEYVDPGASVSVYAMQEPWVEDEATFDNASDGVPWSWPEAYDGSDSVSALDLSTQAFGPVEFDVTRLVRVWVSGERANNGLALVADNGVLTHAKFRSGDENDSDEHPRLTVTYACECGVVCVQGGSDLDVLMFVKNGGNPDDKRVALLESWGYSVAVIDDGASATDIADAVASASVVYVSSTVDKNKLSGELASLPIGIVSEQAELLGEIGLASDFGAVSLDGVKLTDVSHYITSGQLANAFVQLTDGNKDFHVMRGSIASGAQRLATEPTLSAEPSLAVLEAGAVREDGALTIARRVNLPWAGDDDKFDVDELTTDGRKILRRSLEWAAASAGRYPGFFDNFATQTCVVEPDYTGSIGEADWTGNSWLESSDDGASCTGKIRLADDPVVPDGSNKRLLFAGEAEFVRSVDLTGYANAYLRLQFRRSGTSSNTQQVRVLASADDTFYTEIEKLTGFFATADYNNVVIDISPYISPTTHLKFVSESLNESRRLYLDNVSVSDVPP